MRTQTLATATVLLLGLATPWSAIAAPCAGFTDVDSASSLCANVEWIRNRGITLGCTSTTAYCPTDGVIRLHMAAFMTRLGAALTPATLAIESAPGAVDLDLLPVVCATSDFNVANYPRRAVADLTLAGIAPADIGLTADLVYSANAGASWAAINTVATPGRVAANQWGNVANIGTKDLNVGQVVRFGIRLARVAGSGDLSNSRCNLRVMIYSRDGASSPY